MKTFHESHSFTVTASSSDKKGSDWEVVLIEAGLSRNGNYYPAEVLKASLQKFEGLKACAYRYGDNFDHLPEGVKNSFSQNVVGFFENVRFGSFKRPDGTSGEGVIGNFHVLEGADWLRKNMKDAFVHGHPDLLGFSIDAVGEARPAVMNGQRVKVVERIDKARSTDVVSEPAAGGSLLRLVASTSSSEVTMKGLFEILKQSRPSWLEGFATPEGDINDFVIRVVEANVMKAQEEFLKVPSDEVSHLAEVARGVKTLSDLLSLLKGGKVEDAMKVIAGWISAYPEPKMGKVGYAYAYPYAPAADGGYPAPMMKEKCVDEKDSETKNKEKKVMAEAAVVTPAAVNPEMEAREKALRVRESDLRVKEAVITSNLPEIAKARVSELFVGRESVTKEEIEGAIAKERAYIATFSESGKVKGLGDSNKTPEIVVGDGKIEKFGKAWDGFFNGGMEVVDGVRPFKSLKEAWGAIENKWYDNERLARLMFRGIALGFPNTEGVSIEDHGRRLKESWNECAPSSLRESVTTSTWSVTFGAALYRRLQKAYNAPELNDWKKIISSVESFVDATNPINIIRIGEQTVLPVVNQNAPYQEGTDPSELVEQLQPAKYGRILKLTWEDILADHVGIIRKIPNILGRSTVRTVQQLVWNQIESNPTMADNNALISANHANLVSGSPVLSYAEFVNAVLLLRDQTEQNSGEKLGLSGKYLLVGPKLEAPAYEITDSEVKDISAHDATLVNVNKRWNVQAFPTIGLGRTSSTDDHWYVMADPQDVETISVGFLGGRETGDIFVQGVDTPTAGSMFDADSITFKVRLVCAAKVVDWRGIAGSLQ